MVTRARRSTDWDTDLRGAVESERKVCEMLRNDSRFSEVEDHTSSFETLDFSFGYRGATVWLDVKEKRRRYSSGIQALWPTLREPSMFIVDETVFRRIVWQGGGGYLLIHDVPQSRWLVMGPWELTLGPQLRYGRWGQRNAEPFLKGKLLVNLESAATQADELASKLITDAIDASRRWRTRVEPYPIHGSRLRELGDVPDNH